MGRGNKEDDGKHQCHRTSWPQPCHRYSPRVKYPEKLPDILIDPEKLKKAHVIVTSYSIVASEYGAFNPEAKDEGKKKKKAQASQDQDSDDSSDLGRYLQKNKKPAKAPKIKDALFRIKWWRIILGEYSDCRRFGIF